MDTPTATPTVTKTLTGIATPTNTPGPTNTPLPCTGQQVGSSCWFLGAPGESCDLACADLGRSCSLATGDFAGFPIGTLPNCAAVLAAFALPFPQDIEYAGGGVGCGNAEGPYREISVRTRCDASVDGFSRACACL